MLYDAISIDTQTVMEQGFAFEKGLLAQLSQFKDSAIEVVISEIILKEIVTKITNRTRAATEALIGAARSAKEFHLITFDEEKALGASLLAADRLAQERVDRFIITIGAHIIPIESASLRNIVESYFKSMPPFSPTGKKKNEFPDAIALLSLEKWASVGRKNVLAVSGDNDWEEFAKKSTFIEVTKSLADALSLLQEHADQAKKIVARLFIEVSNGAHPEKNTRLKNFIKQEFPTSSLYGEANSSFEVEFWMFEEINILEIDYSDINSEEDAVIVLAGRRKIVAQVPVKLLMSLKANFSLSVYDSTDKDTVSMGSANTTKREWVDILINVTIEGDFASDTIGISEIAISDISIEKFTKTIHFGDIEPDWINDNEFHKNENNEPQIPDDQIPF